MNQRRNFFFGIFFHSLCAVVIMQKLCSEKPPNERVGRVLRLESKLIRFFLFLQDPKDCCSRLPSPVDASLNEMCIANFAKNTERQQKEIHSNEMPKGNCVSECIANSTKIYRGNGLVDRINLARIFFNAVSGEKEWGTIVEIAVDTCINESEFSLAPHSAPL